MEKKRTILHVVICVGLLCVIWGIYILSVNRVEAQTDDFSWVYQIESVYQKEGEFVLEGFAFEEGIDSGKRKAKIVLQDMKTEKRVFAKMEYMNREDVNRYFQCEYDYTKSGFVATIKSGKIDLEEDYEILLNVGNGSFQKTGMYVSNGELIFTDPEEYEPLNVKGTDLEVIVEQGILRVYEPMNHIYVYQYENDLYWIATEEYGFVEGDTQIMYQLQTTQMKKVSGYQIEGDGKWISANFMFAENELELYNVAQYRVAKKSLPTEYSITRISTGNYSGEWLWKVHFRPWYDLK